MRLGVGWGEVLGMKAILQGAVAWCLLVAGALEVRGHDPVAEQMARAAETFLASLNAEQKEKATFEFKSAERENWHFVPRARKGLPLKEMTGGQRPLAHALLNSGLSHKGYFKATTIMTLEQILHEIEQGRGNVRDPEQYFFSIFGKPDGHGTWGWRVEGHHLSLNFTIVEGVPTATPSFMGTNPAEVRQGPRKGLRVLATEEDLGRKLVKSLSGELRRKAIFEEKAPSDIITGADRKARVLEPKGVSLKELNGEQKKTLWALIEEYVFWARGELAAKELEEIKGAGEQEIYFAWAGSTEPGQGHYYRVQGPGFLLEYDNTQNNANHVHAVWRDLKNDFGDELLKHYEEAH